MNRRKPPYGAFSFTYHRRKRNPFKQTVVVTVVLLSECFSTGNHKKYIVLVPFLSKYLRQQNTISSKYQLRIHEKNKSYAAFSNRF